MKDKKVVNKNDLDKYIDKNSNLYKNISVEDYIKESRYIREENQIKNI